MVEGEDELVETEVSAENKSDIPSTLHKLPLLCAISGMVFERWNLEGDSFPNVWGAK